MRLWQDGAKAMVRQMRKIVEYGLVWAIGGSGYTLLEILWRGYSHWTMTLTGGCCFFFLYLIERAFFTEALWKRCLAGTLSIMLTELLCGFLVNMLLHWNIWDYSGRFLNVYGQICALYSGLWFLLCIPCFALCAFLRRKLFSP